MVEAVRKQLVREEKAKLSVSSMDNWLRAVEPNQGPKRRC
jgi:hypothetical protein